LLVDRRRSYRLFTSGLPGRLPCRPTRPDISVTLMKSSRPVPVDDDNLMFDRRVGFTVRRANSYFNGYFSCVASFHGLTSRQTVVITYKRESWRSIFLTAPSHSYCLSLALCLPWYNGLITPGPTVTNKRQCRLTLLTVADRGMSVIKCVKRLSGVYKSV